MLNTLKTSNNESPDKTLGCPKFLTPLTSKPAAGHD
jgi:hypothetical protein